MAAAGGSPIRVWVIGLGTVGRWVLRAVREQQVSLGERYEVAFRIVGLASRREGFVHDEQGIDLGATLALLAAGRPLRELPRTGHWPTALEGLRATEADLLVEAAASPMSSGEPGASHLVEALGRGIPTVTSNKWPVALHGVRLIELARQRSAVLRAESTVMSGTPVLGPLIQGLAGAAPPTALRGVLNATANFVLSEIARGRSYADVVARAQREGLAEPDPSADLDGHDSVAKLMVLAALVFGRQLRVEDVKRRGISTLTEAEIAAAKRAGLTIRELSALELSGDGPGDLTARVEPVALPEGDLLARVDGTANAVVCEADPLGRIAIVGPGAGTKLAGQGVLSDMINVARGRKAPVG